MSVALCAKAGFCIKRKTGRITKKGQNVMDTNADNSLCIVLMGASGDLVRRKIIPALFHLFTHNLLPENTVIFGFARSNLNDEAFRNILQSNLSCRCKDKAKIVSCIHQFLSNCFYIQGDYASKEDMKKLKTRIDGIMKIRNSIIYMALPSSVFIDAANALEESGFLNETRKLGWIRTILEKPFGKDRTSSDKISGVIEKIFSQEEIYRIDHYLGKEVVQNILALRFANAIFEPIWNRHFIESIQIIWKEDIGVETRGAYFDEYGIIRDIIQNHLMQILALFTMEPPLGLSAEATREEKIQLLRSIEPIDENNVILGQYKRGELNGKMIPDYLQEQHVKNASLTPTYAALALKIHNWRWEDVPVLIKAGKALNEKKTEVRIVFKRAPASVFGCLMPNIPNNQLIARIQPQEAINLCIMSKAPAFHFDLMPVYLNLFYADTFKTPLYDAYEYLLLDVVEGDQSLFISNVELEVLWDIFVKILPAVDTGKIPIHRYVAFSKDLQQAQLLPKKYGIKWAD